ncbi:MAG: hypothetical protein KBC57_03105 [Neisseriaceae bacterium]|nr:hypothetical protein [Neisseriaceae bacterium]MBP6861327.1 hypothetical protein [Neisseriaceae bacterium]
MSNDKIKLQEKIRLRELLEQYETDASFREQHAALLASFSEAFTQAQKLFSQGNSQLSDINHVLEKSMLGFSNDVVEYFKLEGRAHELK